MSPFFQPVLKMLLFFLSDLQNSFHMPHVHFFPTSLMDVLGYFHKTYITPFHILHVSHSSNKSGKCAIFPKIPFPQLFHLAIPCLCRIFSNIPAVPIELFHDIWSSFCCIYHLYPLFILEHIYMYTPVK